MRTTEITVAVCPDCITEYPVTDTHTCIAQGRRKAAELIDYLMLEIENGVGLLWLYRIAYRVRNRMNSVERYADRAKLARKVCDLAGDWVK